MSMPQELPRLGTPPALAWGVRCSRCVHAGPSGTGTPGVVYCKVHVGERFAELDRQCDTFRAGSAQ